MRDGQRCALRRGRTGPEFQELWDRNKTQKRIQRISTELFWVANAGQGDQGNGKINRSGYISEVQIAVAKAGVALT